jgi:hypothetical protein
VNDARLDEHRRLSDFHRDMVHAHADYDAAFAGTEPPASPLADPGTIGHGAQRRP